MKTFLPSTMSPMVIIKKISLFVLWILIIVKPAIVFSQLENIKFEHIAVENGLSQNTVLNILQDNEGFLWFGTQDGLNRYDGFSFTAFKNNPADSTSLTDNFIRRIYKDRSGTLWFGALTGLNKYERKTQSFKRYQPNTHSPASLHSGDIMAMLEDRQGFLWVGTKNGGLERLDQRTDAVQSYKIDSAMTPGTYSVASLFEDEEEVLWMGTSRGLYSLDKERTTFTFHEIPTRQAGDNYVYSIIGVQDIGESVLWMGTLAGGVVKLNRSTGKCTRYVDPEGTMKMLRGSRVWTMICDHNGLFWIGTELGLNIFDPVKEKFIYHAHIPDKPGTIGSHQILTAYEDRSNVIWLGCLNGGINKYNRRSERFGLVRRDASATLSLSHNSVWCFLEDQKSNIWVGTEGGITVFSPDGSLKNVYRQDEKNQRSLSFDVAVTMCNDQNGNIWIGTRGGGLNVFNAQNETFLRIQQDDTKQLALSSNHIIVSYRDASGTLWFGADGGGLIKLVSPADKLNISSFQFVTYRYDMNNPSSISNDVIGVIYEDSKGSFWIGTIGGGLNRMERSTGQFIRYRHNPTDSNSISNDIVTSMYEDGSGALWIGTADGLNRFDIASQQFRHFTDADGLANDFIYGILPDDQGNIWLSTNRGISRFNITNLERGEARNKLQQRCRNFEVVDGLQGYEFNSNAYFRSASGELFFGGPNGFNRFFPHLVRDNMVPPPVIITSFRRLDRQDDRWVPGSEQDAITLEYTDYFFSFEFAALDYINPATNRYSYMMEGFDQFWIDAGVRRFVTYTNLDPGEYVFRVRGSNNDGIWNEHGASVRLLIHSPFWKTWWFISLLILSFGVMVYGIYRFRRSQTLQMEAVRSRLASDLHDELATNLSSIAMFGELLQKSGSVDQEMSEKLKERIITLSRESVNSIREIIWAIDPKPDKLNTLLLKFRDLIQITCQLKNVELTFEIPPKNQIADVMLSPEFRKELWLIIKEAVSNTMKHSSCTTLRFLATYNAGTLVITIQDNGAGFDLTHSFRGKGLLSMRSRVKQLGGNFNVETSPGKGATLTITIVIKK